MTNLGTHQSHLPRRLPVATTALAAVSIALVAALAAPAGALAWTPGTPLTTPFPRLAMWWPDTWSQPVADMARYDWLLLGPWDDPAMVAKIKTQHADEIILNATNACEIDYGASQPADSEDNADLAAVPAQWFLTQCGATLASPVDATATTLHVSAVSTVAPGGATIALFEVGDPVVIEGELARVTGVNASAKTLTVTRGYMKPASAHAGGTRIAATISFWPDSLMMDLTATCPRVTVNATAGPETWAEYNARIGNTLAGTAAWDGILIDRADGDESWLVGNSTARSIDPARANQVPASYNDFDSAWNTGLLGYEVRLRGLLGDSKLLMTNWGLPNYSKLNGNNFEGFPADDTDAMPWHENVFGPAPDVGAYFDWLDARQPNLTTIETYQDDGGPSATGDGSYDNPAAKPGFVPNYRKMRYGLTTALLGDGFFSYEINTDGHGALGLMWFDEYDGAGRGRGWLGQPSAAAERAPGVGTSDVWLRRFSGGISVVNASDAPATVALGSIYRHLLGTQSAGVNNGRLAATVVVPAHDGVVLATADLRYAPELLAGGQLVAANSGRVSRAIRDYYNKRRKHGSHARRKHDQKAYVAWKSTVAASDALARALGPAVSQAQTRDPALVATLSTAEKAATTLVTRAKASYTAGHATSLAKAERTLAIALQSLIRAVAVASR